MSDRVVYYLEMDASSAMEVEQTDIDAAALRWFALCAALGLPTDADPNALAQELREARANVRELEF